MRLIVVLGIIWYFINIYTATRAYKGGKETGTVPRRYAIRNASLSLIVLVYFIWLWFTYTG